VGFIESKTRPSRHQENTMSAETTEAVDPRITAELLGREIFQSLFPHDAEMGDYHYDREVPKEALLKPVEGPEDVTVDSIVLVIDNESWRTTLRNYSGLEALGKRGAYVARVVKVSPKSIVVETVREPRSHGYTADLDAFGESLFKDNSERLMFQHATREIGLVGTLDDLREKIAAHPRMEEWRTVRAAAVATREAELAARKAEREAEETRLAPLKAAVQALVDITGERLVNLSYSDVPRGENDWLEAGEFRRVRVYLAGLNALGDLSDDEHAQALAHLDTIITYAKGEK
jgi:hypothetical protein